MNELITIPDPVGALMLTDLRPDETRRAHSAHRTRGLGARRRRFERAARLRRLLS